MKLEYVLEQKKMSVRRCAMDSQIPYSTLMDLVKGKTSIEKSSVETVYKLAKTLNVSMEELIGDHVGEVPKRLGGVSVIIEVHSPRGVGTVIYVDYKKQEIQIENKTTRIMDTAFGKNLNPTWEDYEKFLEDRCFPRTRDKMKLVLRDVGVDCYDPLQIIRKTKGRMLDDHIWLELYWNERGM